MFSSTLEIMHFRPLALFWSTKCTENLPPVHTNLMSIPHFLLSQVDSYETIYTEVEAVNPVALFDCSPSFPPPLPLLPPPLPSGPLPCPQFTQINVYICIPHILSSQVDSYETIYTEVDAVNPVALFDRWFRVDSKPFKQALLNIVKKWSFMFKQHLIDHVTRR